MDKEIGDNLKGEDKETEDTCPCPPEHVSYFYRSPGSIVPRDILTFHHSFGYNCKKLYNLCLINSSVLVFASGNLIHFYNVTNGTMTFRRSAGGGGIGYITVNPNSKYNYLTIAENGSNPIVLIYKFPELDVVSVLEEGAKESFTCISYSPDGELLATQAGEPCYTLTIWKWKTQSILLRTKSFQNDVLNAFFSPYNPRQIITCGLGHIKFWKISETFTGLKLLGDLGRFGKTEICDIYAIYAMPDEKVISGCEWGNLLVWDDGLIKMEVCRKGRKPCHNAPITIITMNEGEIVTIGMDGYVRFWFWETVEAADPPDDDRFVEIEPIYEFKIGTIDKPCDLRSFLKIYPQEKKDNKYYAQDGYGKIWYCDINIERVRCKSIEILTCHNGHVVAAATSSISTNIATLGKGGFLNMYDYVLKKLLFQHAFISNGTDMLWLSANVDPIGSTLLLGFEDGVIRQIVVNLSQNKNFRRVKLVDVIKAHSQAITRLSVNPKENILVSGSKDCTVFVFSIHQNNSRIQLIPIGFLKVQSAPTAFNWNEKNTELILIGCCEGEVYEANLPDEPCDYTNVSYHLHQVEMKKYVFKSCKSEIRHQLKIEETAKRKEKKRQRKIEKMNKLKKENPGVDIDEDIFLQDSDPEEELEPLYYPKIPNPILWLRYTPENLIWLSLAGYDAGYIYERDFNGNHKEKIKNILVTGGDDNEIHSYLIIQNYLIFGMQDGCIRINAIKEDFRDLSDFWKLSMHDNLNGTISKICASYDENYLFSTGYDGNIFAYKWNGPRKNVEIEKFKKDIQEVENIFNSIETVQDIDDLKHPSLEEQKNKDDQVYRLHLATERKERILDIIADHKLTYKDITKRNRDLPRTQRFTLEELELDPRITFDLIQSMEEKLNLVRRKLSFDLEKAKLAKEKVMEYFINPLECYPFEVMAIRSNKTVKTFRIKRLTEEFHKAKIHVEECITQELNKRFVGKDTDDELYEKTRDSVTFDDSLLFDISSDIGGINLSDRIKRVLKRYGERKSQEFEFMRKIEEHNNKKPNINVNDKSDMRNIAMAEQTIGDYKLKSDVDYKHENNQTVSQKFKQILEVREELFNLRNGYNDQIKNLRKEKMEIYEFVKKQKNELNKIHEVIPKEKRKYIEDLPKIHMNLEYPENNLKPTVNLSVGVCIKDILYRKLDRQTSSESSDTLIIPKNYADIIASRQEKLNQDILNIDKNIELPEFNEICRQIDNLPKFSVDETPIEELQQIIAKQKELPWEIEMRYDYIINKLIKQDEIIEEVNYQISDFDKRLEKIANDRLHIELDTKFLEQFLITLNQEFWILKSCESTENELLQKIEDTMLKRNQIQLQIAQAKRSIEDDRKAVEKLREQIKILHENFMKLIKNNKFADFLQRIFRKKFKPPKIKEDEDDSSLSSDSSESSEEIRKDDEIEDEDSLQLSPIRLDESICPPGLDVKIYDETFALRGQRHVLENQIYIKQKNMEEKKKETNDLSTQKRNVEGELENDHKKLNSFMYEKQSLLNKIQTLVVLRLDQISCYQQMEDLQNATSLENVLLFDTENIVKLHNRVEQLQIETLDIKNQHKLNIAHLGHIKSEIHYMNQQKSDLEEQVKMATIKKFGKNINIDELERLTIRKYIFDKKVNLEDEKRKFDKIMEKKKAELVKYEKELIYERQKGTEKLNILAVLQEEKNFLTEMLLRQQKIVEKFNVSKLFDYAPDLMKLKDIEKQQLAQIEFLEKEIRTLRIKTNMFRVERDDTNYLNILSTHTEFDYDDQHICLNFQDKVQASSKLSSAMYSPLVEKVSQIIQNFLQNILASIISLEDVTILSRRLSDYIVNIPDINQPGNVINDELMQDIIINFQNLIPSHYVNYTKPSDILLLLNEILDTFKKEQKDKCKIEEIMLGIIQNSLDIVKQTASKNFTQDFINEIFCQMIEVLSTEDMGDPKVLEVICESFLKDSEKTVYKNIDVDVLIETIKKHSATNQIEDVNLEFLKDLANKIISKLKEKYEES